MIRAIHIEDEPGNIELLQSLIKSNCGKEVELCGTAATKTEAIALIQSVKPQLLYLDIELKKGNAFDLLEELYKMEITGFQVIFITAFNQYAVKAFRYNALDYLLKPINVDELKDATNRAINNINRPSAHEKIINVMQQLKSAFGAAKIGVPVSDGLIFVNVDKIIKAEAKGSYCILYLCDGQKLTAVKTLKDIELLLPEQFFIRIHHSWIINTKYLKKYYRLKNSYVEMEDGSIVPVSVRKKGDFLDQF